MKKIFIQITLVFSILSLFIVSGCASSTPLKNKYTVTFKDYDGTVLRTEKIEEGHNATAPNDPTRHGYIFTGWDQEYTNIQKDTIITAQYKRDESVLLEYKVIFKDYNGDILKEEIVEEGHNATAPSNPEREGYIFVGWDQEYTNIKNDLDVFAKYDTIKYSIKYELNEGTLKKENPSEYSIEDSFELKKPLKDGFTFEGWYTNPEFTGSKVESILKGTTGNIELYAKYNAIEYNITYKLDDGTNNSINPNEYTILDEIILEAPTKEGYKFIGWELNGTIIQSIHKGTIGNLVLQAKWQINKYTITFNTDGGSNIDSITQDYNTEIVKPADPTKEGYTFVGWDKEIPTTMPAENITIKALWGIGEYFIKFDTDGGTRISTIVQDYNTEIVKPADPTKEGYTFVGWDQEIPTTMPAENLTIKALWQVNKYTITFDTDGGNDIDDLEFTIETEDLILPTPIKDKYNFLGWYENDVLVEEVELRSYNLVAKWSLIISLDYQLSSDETHYIVTGIGNVSDSELKIPSTYRNLPVKEIGERAFFDCTSLTSIEIPDSVTSIGNHAFKNCTGLENIIIPDSVTNIGAGTFIGCTNLLSIIIPSNVISIEGSLLKDCTSLESVVIGNSVTSIGNHAFQNCTSLTNIEIPNSVITIGTRAFAYCSYLNNVTIGDNVTSIGDYAFMNCTSLINVEIPKSVTSFGRSIFYGCTSLKDISVDKNNEFYKSIDGNLYTIDGTILIQYAIGKEEQMFDIPESVTSIVNYAFLGCISLTSIIIPSSITNIGYSAFANCTNLTIYCEATSKPEGWDDGWNYSNCQVVWGYVNLDIYEENGYKYINFGRYPQTVVTDEYIISALSNITIENDLGYIEYNGNEYKKVVAIPYDSNYTFINGNTIIEGNTYYFLVEPIKWRVLEENDGTYKLLSEIIVDNKPYYQDTLERTINNKTIYANNYEYSNIRAWLNGYDGSIYNVENYSNNGFFNIAFTESEQKLINSTLVDNSINSSDQNIEKYVCNNTIDKIYLLSVNDAINTNYGFSNNTLEHNSREALCSDYTRSNYCWMSVETDYYGMGGWLLRTPSLHDSTNIRFVCHSGWLHKSYSHYSYIDYASIRPAITISTNESKDYQVVFKDYNGNPLKIEEVNSGDNATPPTDPSREYYNFIGWDKEYTNVQGDLEVKALYEPIIYTITFDTDGGNVINCLDFTIETQNLTLPTPIKDGYEFKGWYENDVLVETVELKDYSLLAKWEEIQSLEFELSSDETYYIVVGIGNVTDTDIVIPSKYKNLPVKTIGSNAFYNCTNLTSVSIEEGISTIEDNAFNGCKNLVSIELPSTLRIIKNTVSMSTYGARTFLNCSNLTNVYFKGTLEDWCSISFSQGDESTPMYYADHFFMLDGDNKYYEVTEIEIPEGINEIGYMQFYGFENLTKVTISDSVESLNEYAFYKCTNLKSIYMSSNVKKVNQFAFKYCEGLENVYYDGTIDEWLNIVWSADGLSLYGPTPVQTANPMYYAENLYLLDENNEYVQLTNLEYIIPNTWTRLPASFKYLNMLTKITIPNTITNVYDCPFYGCIQLKDVYYEGTIEELLKISYSFDTIRLLQYGENFYVLNEYGEYYNVTEIDIPNSITNISENTFYNCDRLTKVIIPSTVTYVGANAFKDCDNLTIYCEATSQPEDWDSNWNPSNCPVIWGYKEIKIYEENDKEYINLGRYPQTVVTDETTISALSNISTINSLGYIEYNGNEYKKVVANPYSSNYTFINGNTIIEGNTYYFKVEPIKWRVLAQNDGTYQLLSEMILDNTYMYPLYNEKRNLNGYTVNPNNYEYSNIRAWLNGYNGSSYNVDNFVNKGFLDVAFTEDEKLIINNTLVDNSLASTGDSSNANVCNNTIDKVYLLSRADLLNENYNFDSDYSVYDIERRAQVSDYARSKGCSISTTSPYTGCGYWWLRSPSDWGYISYMRVVQLEGYIYQGSKHSDVHWEYVGIRPAMTITLK